MNASATGILTVIMRITRIRMRNRNACVFFGHRVDLDTAQSDRSSALVVFVPSSLINPKNFEVGEIWQVYGESKKIKREVDRFVFTETQIDAQDAYLLKPSGSQIVQWLEDNVVGIGGVKAQKLWDSFGEGLYEILETESSDVIAAIIPAEHVREGLFAKWAADGNAHTLKFVQEHGVPVDLARKAIRFHKNDTVDQLLDDPYRLLSFSGSWKLVDELARERFGIAVDDCRRLAAALEEALYSCLDNGDTAQSVNALYKRARYLLKPHPQPNEALQAALEYGQASGQFIVSEYGGETLLHASGTWVMEKAVGQFILDLLKPCTQQGSLFESNVDELLADFEKAERSAIGAPEFALNDAQVRAVKTSFENRFSIITGGAGVGKTTVLKALYRVLDTLGRPRFQMALSGRATARMIEATHESATTIAGFIRNVTKEELGSNPIIVIDEASMLDLVSFYSLSRKLPVGTHLILVGDPYQLPPVGAGLILHLLCDLPSIPCTELMVVKRQASNSGIPGAAKLMRDGVWPALPNDIYEDVVFVPAKDSEILATTRKLYEQDQENTQILSATKSCPFAGVGPINRDCHARYVSTAQPLLLKNTETDDIEDTGFRVGDLLLYTANDWPRNLQNGSLGELREVFSEPIQVNVGSEGETDIRLGIGRAVFEGVAHYVLDTDVDNLDYAYSITVHKSQGSQFPRVIVPIRKSRVLDRTFIYTAVTRAQYQIILVGDEEAARKAVEAPPKAFGRVVGLGRMLALEMLRES